MVLRYSSMFLHGSLSITINGSSLKYSFEVGLNGFFIYTILAMVIEYGLTLDLICYLRTIKDKESTVLNPIHHCQGP